MYNAFTTHIIHAPPRKQQRFVSPQYYTKQPLHGFMFIRLSVSRDIKGKQQTALKRCNIPEPSKQDALKDLMPDTSEDQSYLRAALELLKLRI